MSMNAFLALILIIPCANSFVNEAKEYFVYENTSINASNECIPLKTEQYYLKTINDSISETNKLDCLPKDLSENKYFPKCCPPDHVYHRKHHKCVESNLTNIHDAFGNENVLIRTDLVNCAVVLDHIFEGDMSMLMFIADRSLIFRDRVYKLGRYCLDSGLDDENIVVRTCEEADVCKSGEVKCIKKCCPDGQYYKGNKCYPGPHFGLSLEGNSRFADRNDYFSGIMLSEPCKKYLGGPKFNYYITADGTTVIREQGVWNQYSIDENYYCMEYVQMTKRHEILLCMINSQIKPSTIVRGIFLITSCLCLLLTLIGYLILPDLKNLIGKIIITYCSCLLAAFTFLTWLQFFPNGGEYCDVIAFAIGFLFLTAFTWMTVLSYEIWRALGSMTSHIGHRSPSDSKKFLWYNLFAWPIPIAITLLTFIDYTHNIFPKSIHIVLGGERCVYTNSKTRGMYGYVFHFAAPCGMLLLINTFIFTKTIIYICKVKNEIQRLRSLDSYEKQRKWKTFIADKEKVCMILKISLLMGLSWLFETFSSIFVDFSSTETLSYIENIFDSINALQGVFIFCIFMLKKKILKSLFKILNIRRNKRRSSVATCSTEVVMIPTSARTSKQLH